MNTTTNISIIRVLLPLVSVSLSLQAPAQSRSTSSGPGGITLLHSPAGGGGGTASGGGGTIVVDTSSGDPEAGQNSAPSPSGIQLQANHIAQLYDEKVTSPADLKVTSSPSWVNEHGSRLLAVEIRMDDDSFKVLDEGEATWFIVDGPLTSINANGLATAGIVLGPTPATVRGSYLGFDDDHILTVLDSAPDNFGPVAGDGLDDSWQYNFFDLDNSGTLDADEQALAIPGADPDFDARDNRFEFLTGFSPLNGEAFFFHRTIELADGTATIKLNKRNLQIP